MNIKRAKEEIKNTIEAYLLKDEFGEYAIPSIRQRPILLMGPPGIGKTQIMEQIAQECNVGLVSYTITHHTRQSAVGLPFIKEKTYAGQAYSVTEYTMSEIIAAVHEKMEKTGIHEGILFIDEINCVSETMAPMMLQFLQCKTFGNQKVPEGWIIVAAGNPPEYNKSVRDFDVVTLDRVKRLDVDADFQVWKEYAYKQKLHGAVISYLDIKKKNFYQIETTVDGKLFATARGWEDLSQIIEVYEKMGRDIDAQVVGQYIQYPRIARDFANYLELYYKYYRDYRIDEMLRGNMDPNTTSRLHFAEFDERLSVLGLVISALGDIFRRDYLQDAAVTDLFGRLKEIREELSAQGLLFEDISDATDAARQRTALEQMIDEQKEELEEAIRRGREAGQTDKLKETISRTTIKLLDEMKAAAVNAVSENQVASAFDALRGRFAQEADRRQDYLDETAEMMENAFDFLELAFGKGQELVMFVTELNAGFFSSWYIRENGCDRYYMYNKGLLFADRQKEIAARIEDAKDDMIGANMSLEK